MNLAKLIAAAALATVGAASAVTPAAAAPATSVITLAAAAPAAQDWRYRDRYDRHDRYDRYDRGRHYGWDNGGRYGRDRYRSHRFCRTEWRHHHRVTVCYRR